MTVMGKGRQTKGQREIDMRNRDRDSQTLRHRDKKTENHNCSGEKNKSKTVVQTHRNMDTETPCQTDRQTDRPA